MRWNEHLTRDHRGIIYCSYYKECEDCEYADGCPVRATQNRAVVVKRVDRDYRNSCQKARNEK